MEVIRIRQFHSKARTGGVQFAQGNPGNRCVLVRAGRLRDELGGHARNQGIGTAPVSVSSSDSAGVTIV